MNYPKYTRKQDKRYKIPEKKIQRVLYLWHKLKINNKTLIAKMVGLNRTAVRYYINYDEVMAVKRNYNQRFYYLRDKAQARKFLRCCMIRKRLLCPEFKEWYYEYSRKYHNCIKQYERKE